MCGICGKVYFDQERAVTRQELLAMSTTIAHRVPEGEDVWTAGNVCL
jgi:asparagine synthetase B (glutamine-hydrolysing)